MKFINVIDNDGTVTQKVPYTEKGARVFLYSNNWNAWLWEVKDDAIIEMIPYDSKACFYELRYMELLPALLLHRHCDVKLLQKGLSSCSGIAIVSLRSTLSASLVGDYDTTFTLESSAEITASSPRMFARWYPVTSRPRIPNLRTAPERQEPGSRLHDRVNTIYAHYTQKSSISTHNTF